jgi:hypothetical protein
MGTKSREVIWGGQIMGAEIRARQAREEAKKAAREADRAEAHRLVAPHGGLRRTRSALANHRPMPQRRLGLARGGVQSLQDPGEPAARCHPPAAGDADMEAGSLAEMPTRRKGRSAPPGERSGGVASPTSGSSAARSTGRLDVLNRTHGWAAPSQCKFEN